MEDKRVIQSFVWYIDKCFLVSTIERDSSAAIGPVRYNETIVWKYHFDDARRGEMIYVTGDRSGCLSRHFSICQELRDGNLDLSFSEADFNPSPASVF